MSDESLEERINVLEEEVAQLKTRLDEKDSSTVTITKTTGSQNNGTLTFHEKLEIHRHGNQRWGELYPVTDRDEEGLPIYGDPERLTADEVAEYREEAQEN